MDHSYCEATTNINSTTLTKVTAYLTAIDTTTMQPMQVCHSIHEHTPVTLQPTLFVSSHILASSSLKNSRKAKPFDVPPRSRINLTSRNWLSLSPRTFDICMMSGSMTSITDTFYVPPSHRYSDHTATNNPALCTPCLLHSHNSHPCHFTSICTILHTHISPPPSPLYPHTPPIQHMFVHTSTQPPISCTHTQSLSLSTRPQSTAAPLLTSSSVTVLRRFLIIMMVLGSGSAVFYDRGTQQEGNSNNKNKATWSHCEVACSPKLLLTSQHAILIH